MRLFLAFSIPSYLLAVFWVPGYLHRVSALSWGRWSPVFMLLPLLGWGLVLRLGVFFGGGGSWMFRGVRVGWGSISLPPHFFFPAAVFPLFYFAASGFFGLPPPPFMISDAVLLLLALPPVPLVTCSLLLPCRPGVPCTLVCTYRSLLVKCLGLSFDLPPFSF